MFSALEYETNYGAETLQPFFDSSLPMIRHPEIKSWGADLSAERDRLQSKPSSST
jgi:putative hydrolase of HD superfamily